MAIVAIELHARAVGSQQASLHVNRMIEFDRARIMESGPQRRKFRMTVAREFRDVLHVWDGSASRVEI